MPVASEKQIHEPNNHNSDNSQILHRYQYTNALIEKKSEGKPVTLNCFLHYLIKNAQWLQKKTEPKSKKQKTHTTTQNSRAGELKWEAEKKVHDP